MSHDIYERPALTIVDKPIQLRARVKEMQAQKALVTCSLYSEDVECARGEVVAVQVPAGLGPGN